jgi:methylmalonyl-CoA/ethylmalonyl-CoA epimerase
MAEQAISLDEIGQIALTVTDLPEAKAFYQNILGMRFLFDAGTMAFFQCGTVRLLIGTSDKPTAPGGTILYFRVADIHAAHAALRQSGVSFVQEPHLVARMKSHDLWLAFLNDPSGNALALMSELPRATSEEHTQ